MLLGAGGREVAALQVLPPLWPFSFLSPLRFCLHTLSLFLSPYFLFWFSCPSLRSINLTFFFHLWFLSPTTGWCFVLSLFLFSCSLIFGFGSSLRGETEPFEVISLFLSLLLVFAILNYFFFASFWIFGSDVLARLSFCQWVPLIFLLVFESGALLFEFRLCFQFMINVFTAF